MQESRNGIPTEFQFVSAAIKNRTTAQTTNGKQQPKTRNIEICVVIVSRYFIYNNTIFYSIHHHIYLRLATNAAAKKNEIPLVTWYYYIIRTYPVKKTSSI